MAYLLPGHQAESKENEEAQASDDHARVRRTVAVTKVVAYAVPVAVWYGGVVPSFRSPMRVSRPLLRIFSPIYGFSKTSP